MINNALRDEIGALNASKGWHDEPRSIAQHCILLHSEVSEIVEDYRKNKEIDEVWYEYEDASSGLLQEKEKQLWIVVNNYTQERQLTLGKPCGIPSELADVVIRALDMSYEYGFNIYDCNYQFNEGIENVPFEDLIADIHYSVSQIYHTEDLRYLLNVYEICNYIANRYNINLEQQIRDKIEYNKTRPVRHGNKRL